MLNYIQLSTSSTAEVTDVVVVHLKRRVQGNSWPCCTLRDSSGCVDNYIQLLFEPEAWQL